MVELKNINSNVTTGDSLASVFVFRLKWNRDITLSFTFFLTIFTHHIMYLEAQNFLDRNINNNK